MSKLKRILPGRKVRLKQAGFFAVLFLFLVMFLPAQSPQAEGAVPLAAPAEEAPLPLPAATETDTFAAPAALAASPDSADWLDSLVETVHAGFLAGLAEMNGNGNGAEPDAQGDAEAVTEAAKTGLPGAGETQADAPGASADTATPQPETAAPPATPAAAPSEAAETAPRLHTFDTLLAAAMEGNRDLAGLRIDRQKAVIQKKKARASQFPSIDFQTTMSWLANPVEKISLTAGELGSIQVGTEEILLPPYDVVLYEGMENTYYQFKTTVIQPIFTWGKISTAKELASLGQTGADLQLLKKKREIETQIQIYLTVLAYTEKMELILSRQAEASERLLKLAEDSYRNGFIIYTDLLDARIRTKQIEIGVVQVVEQREQTLLKLAHLCGLPFLEMENLDLSGYDVSPEEVSLPEKEASIASAREDNTDIQLLKLLTDVQRLQGVIAAAGGYLKPDIGIQIELSYSGSRFPFIETDWFGQDDYSLTASLAFQGSVWDGGIKGAEIEESARELESVLYQYEEGLSTITQFITETYLTLELLRRKMEYQKLKIENDFQQIDLKRTQYRTGSGTEIDYISAQLGFYGDVIELYRLEIDFCTNYQSLLNVTGKSKEKSAEAGQ